MLLLGACSGGGGDELVLDGTPRRPDAEGVVTAISFQEIRLDGGRTYKVSKELQSFSTYDLAATPMLQRKGQYVQLGVDGDVAEWMAGIGVVVRAAGRKPVVFYNGDLVEVDGDEAVFADGTVLTLAEGAAAGVPKGPVRAEINPSTHRAERLSQQ